MNKEFYQKELDSLYELLNMADKYSPSQELTDIKNTVWFRIRLLEKIIAELIN